MIPVLILLHLLSAVIWVGGMFFAYIILRPVAAAHLEPPIRLQLWVGNFQRFFFWVWIAIIILISSGYWMITLYGGMAAIGKHIHIMQALAWLMIAIYMYVYFQPYRHLRIAVDAQNYPEGAIQLAKIRQAIAINLTLGIVIIAVASVGRYLL